MNKPFPKVEIADKVWKGRLAVYNERSEPRQITLSSALTAADAQTRRYIVFHEIGHWFRQEHVPGKISRPAEETFAHSFASFMLAPQAFAKAAPEEHQRMAVLLSPSNRKKLSGFARRVLARL